MVCREKREIKAIRIPDGVRPFSIKSSCGMDVCDTVVESGDYLVWANDDSDPCVYSESDFNQDFDVVDRSDKPETGPISIPSPLIPPSPLFPNSPPYIPAGMRQCTSCGAHMPYGQIHVCYHTNPFNGQVVYNKINDDNRLMGVK